MYDVMIIGAGAAGLSAALTVSRARRRVLVVDSGTPRNAPAGHVHNYLGREGTPPAELYAIGRAEVAAYGGEVVDGVATSAAVLPGGGFAVTLASGETPTARRLLVTTGLTDTLPEVPGLAARWGRDVLHCPYCHGWEVRDRRIGVLGTSAMAVQKSLLWRQWSPHVTLLRHTAPDPGPADRARLRARGVDLVDDAVTGVEVTDDRLAGVRLAAGGVVALDAIAVQTVLTARSDVLESLGVKPVEFEAGGMVLGTRVPAEPSGATSVPGLYVAGNVTDPMAQVLTAAAAGLTVAATINMDLIQEESAVPA